MNCRSSMATMGEMSNMPSRGMMLRSGARIGSVISIRNVKTGFELVYGLMNQDSKIRARIANDRT